MMMMKKTLAVLATLDTKGPEGQYVKEQIEECGHNGLLIDTGVVGEPAVDADVTREEVAEAGGTPLSELLNDPTQDKAHPVMAAGASAIMKRLLEQGKVHGVIGMGGTQGTSLCTRVMQALPYGFPKVMVSTLASGNVSSFIDIKDITMMFSVSDILGLNPVMKKILANAAGAACGMANVKVKIESEKGDKPLIGMTNIGLATRGTLKAVEKFKEKGYDVIVFHAVGSGGRAMEQMMKEGIIGAVLDYALVEIPNTIYGGLNAAGPERLTTAGKLGIPQVICPAGVEHIGLILSEPHKGPEEHLHRKYYFHSPIIFVYRLEKDEMLVTAKEIVGRLRHTTGEAVFMIPAKGFDRSCYEGAPLYDPEGDQAFIQYIKENLPKNFKIVELPYKIEDMEFVEQAVDNMIALIEKRT
jgi:uncharacterized protein (UPF0261 family)